jgi:hypothetical protein
MLLQMLLLLLLARGGMAVPWFGQSVSCSALLLLQAAWSLQQQEPQKWQHSLFCLQLLLLLRWLLVLVVLQAAAGLH